MRSFLTLLLLAVVACPAFAEENEAEKLFRAMEKKVSAAKTLQVRFSLSVTDGIDKQGAITGTLTLGEGDKYRAEGDGKLFGQAVKFTAVCDGTHMKEIIVPETPKEGASVKSSKGIGAYYRESIPRQGFLIASLRSGQREKPVAEKLSDFKLLGKETVGERNARVVQFSANTNANGNEVLTIKIWLDTDTNLPVKLEMTGGMSDIKDITETYVEFTIDAKVEAKLFELPK